MDFTKHYFNEEEPIEEKWGDIISQGPTGALKAVGQRAGVAALNVLRGITGKTKDMVFEPGWLKVLKPVSQKKYLGAMKEYSDWKNKKSKLGPKKNFSVVDIKNGVQGKYTGDDLISLLAKYDPNMKRVNMDSEIPPRMTIYTLNNKGKVVFFDLPIGKDGKKRYYAIGLDNKAERAFTLIHAMRFQDYAMEAGEEGEKVEKKKREKKEPTASDKGLLKHKYEVPKDQYNKLIPKVPKLKLAASYEYPMNLLDMFEEEILNEKDVKVAKNSSGAWATYSPKQTSKQWAANDLKPGNNYIAVDEKGNASEEIQKQLDADIKKKYPSEEDKPEGNQTSQDDKGELYNDLKDSLDTAYPPSKVKPSEKTKSGWIFRLKGGGVIYVYETNDGRHMVAFDDKAKPIIDKKDLINKYKLEVSDEIPEEESPE